jgi:hypothetical protein
MRRARSGWINILQLMKNMGADANSGRNSMKSSITLLNISAKKHVIASAAP